MCYIRTNSLFSLPRGYGLDSSLARFCFGLSKVADCPGDEDREQKINGDPRHLSFGAHAPGQVLFVCFTSGIACYTRHPHHPVLVSSGHLPRARVNGCPGPSQPVPVNLENPMNSQKQTSMFDNSLDPRLHRAFAPMCERLCPDDAANLAGQVDAYLENVRKSLRQNEFIDVALAERIAIVLSELLSGYSRYSLEDQSLIVGAARYFIEDSDIEPDTSLLGFDDDACVLDFVLREIGRNDLGIES